VPAPVVAHEVGAKLLPPTPLFDVHLSATRSMFLSMLQACILFVSDVSERYCKCFYTSYVIYNKKHFNITLKEGEKHKQTHRTRKLTPTLYPGTCLKVRRGEVDVSH
jgi:hypothetical protein